MYDNLSPPGSSWHCRIDNVTMPTRSGGIPYVMTTLVGGGSDRTVVAYRGRGIHPWSECREKARHYEGIRVQHAWEGMGYTATIVMWQCYGGMIRNNNLE